MEFKSITSIKSFPAFLLLFCSSLFSLAQTCPIITSQPVNQTGCRGSKVTFTVSVSGNSMTYQWRKNGVNISGANSGSYTTPILMSADNASIYSVVISKKGCPNITSNNAELTVNTTPNITSTIADQTTCMGNHATFNVIATGTNLSYQWKKNGNNIIGASSSSYTTSSTTLADNGSLFSVIVSNTSCTPATSNNATLTVNPAPVITTQPVNSVVCVGSTPKFSVSGTGTSMTYQWRKNGINISKATASSYTTPATQSTDNGAIYSVVITSAGCASVISNNATLTVNTKSPVITTQPASISVCAGNKATFNVVATGASLNYQWRVNNTNIAGATGSSYTTDATSLVDNSKKFTVVVTSGGCSTTSSNAVLTVNKIPTITTQPSNQMVCIGSTATFTVSASGTNLTYQWKKNGIDISGATLKSYTTPITTSSDNGAQYSVVVSSAGCSSTTSSSATLSLNSLPIITTQPVSKNVTVGASASFTVIATGSGLTYQWRKNGASITGATNASYTILATTFADAANYTVVVTNNIGCSIVSNNATLSINNQNRWTGSSSKDWFTLGNWSSGIIPNNLIDITIPAWLANYPVINTNTIAVIRSINIAAGASVTLTDGATLQVFGDFSNSGNFTANKGTVSFNGAAVQTISGTSVTSFYNLNINNTVSGVKIANQVNLINILTLSANAKFATTGYEFVLLSDANTTARIAPVPTGVQFTGNIRMQRYIPANGRYWFHIASPVTGATVAMWQAGAPTGGFYVTGPFEGASNPGNGVISNGVSAYDWDELTSSWNRFPVSTNQEQLVPKNGYRVFIRDGNASYNGGKTVAKTFSVLGTPNMGDQTINLTYNSTSNNGWNLIGNPYASNITGDLSNSAWTNKTNLDGNAIYMWDADAQKYVSCNGGIGSCIIPSSQAFWVKVKSGGGKITATENAKVDGSLSLFKKSAPNYIPVKLSTLNKTKSDIVYLRFEEDATNGFDETYDAYKMELDSCEKTVSDVSISTVKDSTFYSIDARPLPTYVADTMVLNVKGNDGTYTLDFSDKLHLASTDYQWVLIDHAENDSIIYLKDNPVYTFKILKSYPQSSGKRFKLLYGNIEDTPTISSSSGVAAQSFNIYPNPIEENYFILDLNDYTGRVGLSISDLNGTEVMKNEYQVYGMVRIDLNQELSSGVYFVSVNGEGINKRIKFIVK